MMKLLIQDSDGNKRYLNWEPQNAYLSYEDGLRLPPFPIKAHQEVGVQILLGRKCNFRCAYCSQQEWDYEDHCTGGVTKAKELVKKIAHYVRHYNNQEISFRFWGGEPLVYFEELKEITLGLKKEIPVFSKFAVICNGSLLTKDIVDFFVEHSFSVAISHDGPSQHLRGRDPLKDNRPAIDYMLEKMPNAVSFNPVLPMGNTGQLDVYNYLKEQLGGKDFVMCEAMPVYPYNYPSLDLAMKSQEELENYSARLYLDLFKDESRMWSLLLLDLSFFLTRINSGCYTPSSGKCGAFNVGMPTVIDMDGNVYGCVNVDADFATSYGATNLLGHLDRPKHIKPHGLRTWTSKENCLRCPVLPLCRGECPMIEDPVLYQARCNISYYHYLALFSYAIYIYTGCCLLDIEGDYYLPFRDGA